MINKHDWFSFEWSVGGLLRDPLGAVAILFILQPEEITVKLQADIISVCGKERLNDAYVAQKARADEMGFHALKLPDMNNKQLKDLASMVRDAAKAMLAREGVGVRLS